MAETAELLARFGFGGALVCAFSALGEALKPKTVSGLFGAAPSVALASLALSFASKGPEYAAREAPAMLLGAVALFAYGAACVGGVQRKGVPVWLSAGAAWIVWFAVALSLWGLAEKTGIVS